MPQLLMRAYEMNPHAFTDGQLDIPESHNHIPDLLDEALWGVATWEQLQERDGGVRGGVESYRHPWGIYPADKDPLPYWTYAEDPQVSARAAGLFAQASRLVAQFDPAHARRLRSRAERAYRYAQAHHASDVFSLYGASELYRLTGDARYRADFEQHWHAIGQYGAFSNFTNHHDSTSDYIHDGEVMPDYILGYLGTSGRAQDLFDLSEHWLTNAADQAAHAILRSSHAHRNPRPDGYAPDWGNGTVMGRWVDPILARMSMGDLAEADRQRYFDAISVAADYVLGANPLGMVFITGLGTVSPQEPLHLDSLVWIARGQGPIPGIPVYGPVRELPHANYYHFGTDHFFPAFDSRPLMLRYADLHSFVNTNECTVWECMAPNAEQFAVLIAPGLRPPASWLPGHPDQKNPLPTGQARGH